MLRGTDPDRAAVERPRRRRLAIASFASQVYIRYRYSIYTIYTVGKNIVRIESNSIPRTENPCATLPKRPTEGAVHGRFFR